MPGTAVVSEGVVADLEELEQVVDLLQLLFCRHLEPFQALEGGHF